MIRKSEPKAVVVLKACSIKCFICYYRLVDTISYYAGTKISTAKKRIFPL
jgi:hypothetical protein